MKAIILAAGAGNRLKEFTDEPKSLIRIKDEPIIVRSIRLLKKAGIADIVIVVGYKSEKIIEEVKELYPDVVFVKNDDFKEGSILSLWSASKELEGDVLIMDADIYYEEALLERLVSSKKKDFFLIDQSAAKDHEAVIVGFNDGRAVALARGLVGSYHVAGEWAGFLKLSDNGAKRLKKIIEMKISGGERREGYEFIVPELFNTVSVSYELISGLRWVEIDFPEDITKAENLRL